MKRLRRAFHPALALLLAVCSPVSAASLFRGLVSAIRPIAPAIAPVAPLAPRLQSPLPTLAPIAAFGQQPNVPKADGQEQAAALDAAFDRRFVEAATSLFHPSLAQGQQPSVAAGWSRQAGPNGAIPSDDEMHKRMALSPLTNPEREAALIKLYQLGGAAATVVDVPRGQAPRLDLFDTVQSQDAGRNRHNLIVVKKGKTDRIVVVGAHHDKVSEGAGTIDNWTGSTMLTNLHQALNGVETDATFVFIGFAREEEGLIGSAAFLNSLSVAQRARIDSMVNLDTLGVDGTFSWKNNSTQALLDMIKKVAARERHNLTEAVLDGGDADSSSFRRMGIAAMTIFGASAEVIFDIIHSSRDTMAAFSLPHYRNAYLLTLSLLKTLDKEPIKQPAI